MPHQNRLILIHIWSIPWWYNLGSFEFPCSSLPKFWCKQYALCTACVRTSVEKDVMVASIVIVKSTLIGEHDLWMQWLYICMLCIHQSIKGLAKLVTIVKSDEILSPSLYVWCGRDQKYITTESFSNSTPTKRSSKAAHGARRRWPWPLY